MRIIAVLSLLALSACVSADVATSYAERAHPECESHYPIGHNYGNRKSQTEVGMVCDGAKRSITVKCIHGWGIFSDTTCHENN